MTGKLSFTIVAILLSLGLAACSKSPEQPVPAENYSDTAPPPAEQPTTAPTMPPVPETVPNPADSNSSAAATKTEATAPGEPEKQMMDDASATGMTARTSRGEPTANETAAVEQIQQ